MPQGPHADHYEALQLSPSADTETIERVYRLLAKRYHPDNARSGDVQRFNEVREAYEVLSDPDARAAYDAKYEQVQREQWSIFRQETAGDDRDQDQRLFHSVLSILYIARRRDPENAGLAPMHLERVLGVPREHLDFPLWYLKKKGFLEILETGLMAITVDGVDKLGGGPLSLPDNRLLPETSGARASEPADGEPTPLPRRASGQ